MKHVCLSVCGCVRPRLPSSLLLLAVAAAVGIAVGSLLGYIFLFFGCLDTFETDRPWPLDFQILPSHYYLSPLHPNSTAEGLLAV